MIQRPPPTEVVSDVPGKSSIVDYRETLQRIFGGWLAAGRVVDDGGVRAVDWVIPEGFERAPESSSAVATARTELLRLADEADATANEVAALLRKPTGSEQVRVPRQLAARMGGSGSGDFVMWAESELRPRKEMLTRAAAAVRRAVSRGDFVESAEGRVLLYGWAFLPPNFKGDFQAPAAGSVTLAIVDDPLHSDRAVVAFAWSSRGPVLDVELFRVDGAEAAVAGTRTSVSTDPAQDYWRFPPDEVPPGSRYIARVTGRWGRSDSNIVEIPAAPVIPPPPIAPEPPLAPIIPVAPPPEPVRLPDPPSGSASATAEARLWLLGVAALASLRDPRIPRILAAALVDRVASARRHVALLEHLRLAVRLAVRLEHPDAPHHRRRHASDEVSGRRVGTVARRRPDLRRRERHHVDLRARQRCMVGGDARRLDAHGLCVGSARRHGRSRRTREAADGRFASGASADTARSSLATARCSSCTRRCACTFAHPGSASRHRQAQDSRDETHCLV